MITKKADTPSLRGSGATWLGSGRYGMGAASSTLPSQSCPSTWHGRHPPQLQKEAHGSAAWVLLSARAGPSLLRASLSPSDNHKEKRKVNLCPPAPAQDEDSVSLVHHWLFHGQP